MILIIYLQRKGTVSKSSFTGPELLHHDRLFADVLDLFYHIQLFLNVSFISFESDGHLSVCSVSRSMSTSWQASYFPELDPVPTFIYLWAARIDTLGDFHLFSFDDVVLLIFFDDFFERYNHFAIHECHFNFRLLLQQIQKQLEFFDLSSISSDEKHLYLLNLRVY